VVLLPSDEESAAADALAAAALAAAAPPAAAPAAAASVAAAAAPLPTKELAIAMRTLVPRRKIDGLGFEYYSDVHDPLAGRDILMLWDDPRGWFLGRVSRRARSGAPLPGKTRMRQFNGDMTWSIVFAEDARWGESRTHGWGLEDRTIAMDLQPTQRGPGDENSDHGQWVLLENKASKNSILSPTCKRQCRG
jgi:hypothetical protein